MLLVFIIPEGVVEPCADGLEELSAAFFVKENCPVNRGRWIEVLEPDFLSSDSSDGESVCKGGAKCFEQIEGEGGLSRMDFMQAAYGGVQTQCFCNTGQFIGKECIGVGEQCVDWIKWWATVSALKGEASVFEGWGDRIEVHSGTDAFSSPEFIEGRSCAEFLRLMPEGVYGWEALETRGVGLDST